MTEKILREQTCCFTGHRKIPENDYDTIRHRLKTEIQRLIQEGYINFMCGGALGFDLLAALTVLELKNKYEFIRLIMIIPCQNQTLYWEEEDIELYNDILDQAYEVKILSKVYYNGIMQVRNRYMIDHSSACIAYLRNETGGTAYTLDYAQNGEYRRKIDCILV